MVRRRPRDSIVTPTRATWWLDESEKARFEAIATNLGITPSWFFSFVLQHLESELDTRGVPSWWPEQELKDGELPIDGP